MRAIESICKGIKSKIRITLREPTHILKRNEKRVTGEAMFRKKQKIVNKAARHVEHKQSESAHE